MPLIVAKGLVKEFNNKKVKNRVIKGINLSIEQGEFIAITGESGSGKSTLLYLLSGLDKPTSGGVFYMGKNLALFNDREMAELKK